MRSISAISLMRAAASKTSGCSACLLAKASSWPVSLEARSAVSEIASTYLLRFSSGRSRPRNRSAEPPRAEARRRGGSRRNRTGQSPALELVRGRGSRAALFIIRYSRPGLSRGRDRSGNLQGRVSLEFSLDPAGQLRDARVLEESPPYVFTSVTLARAPMIRYEPARKGSSAVTCVGMVQTVHWRLPPS